MNPSTFRGLFEYFKGKRLPEGAYLDNAIVRDLRKVPRKEQAAKCSQISERTLRPLVFCRRQQPDSGCSSDEHGAGSGSTAVLDTRLNSRNSETRDERTLDAEWTPVGPVDSEPPAGSRATPARTSPKSSLDRVFVSHGRNRELLPQLKELLTFGHFEPVVSVERESVSKPISDKVLDDMRTCRHGDYSRRR